jgi:hypothetical protein
MIPSMHRRLRSSILRALLASAAVLVVSLGGYFVPAAVVSIVALLCLNYFFIPRLGVTAGVGGGPAWCRTGVNPPTGASHAPHCSK